MYFTGKVKHAIQQDTQRLDSPSPPKLRCVLCIVGKRKPIVTKQYLGFIRTYDSFVNPTPETQYVN